jgi:hypothetical protein
MNPVLIQQRQGKVTIKPNQSERIFFSGSYFSILSNTTTVDVIVSAESGSSSPCKAGVGMPTVRFAEDGTTLIPAVFTFLDFRNSSNTETMTVEYLIVLGSADDTRTVVSGYLQMDLSAPKIETSAALTVQTNAFAILPANALIKERLIQNTGDYPIWWGDDNTDPANGRGLKIEVGGFATINCWGAVHFKAEEGASRLSVVNVLKVA